MTAAEFPVLIGRDALRLRIAELGRALAADTREPWLVLVVLEGARTFAAELLRHLGPGHEVREIRASSYGDGTRSTGTVRITGELPDLRGRRVLLLEDIVDTGRTVATLRDQLVAAGASAVVVTALLDKPSRRAVPVQPDHVGFTIPDEFVIGFGLDVGGRYRELPDIVIYRP